MSRVYVCDYPDCLRPAEYRIEVRKFSIAEVGAVYLEKDAMPRVIDNCRIHHDYAHVSVDGGAFWCQGAEAARCR